MSKFAETPPDVYSEVEITVTRGDRVITARETFSGDDVVSEAETVEMLQRAVASVTTSLHNGRPLTD